MTESRPRAPAALTPELDTALAELRAAWHGYWAVPNPSHNRIMDAVQGVLAIVGLPIVCGRCGEQILDGQETEMIPMIPRLGLSQSVHVGCAQKAPTLWTVRSTPIAAPRPSPRPEATYRPEGIPLPGKQRIGPLGPEFVAPRPEAEGVPTDVPGPLLASWRDVIRADVKRRWEANLAAAGILVDEVFPPGAPSAGAGEAERLRKPVSAEVAWGLKFLTGKRLDERILEVENGEWTQDADDWYHALLLLKHYDRAALSALGSEGGRGDG